MGNGRSSCDCGPGRSRSRNSRRGVGGALDPFCLCSRRPNMNRSIGCFLGILGFCDCRSNCNGRGYGLLRSW